LPEEENLLDDACYLDHGVSGYGVAVKLHAEKPLPPEEIAGLLREMMDEIARDCVARGARFVGHIKSHLVCSQGTLKADTIGVKHPAASHGELRGPAKDLYVAINSIVQGISEEEVKQATLAAAHSLAERHRLRVVKEREHLYFDEYDFASDEEHIAQLQAQFENEPEQEDPQR